MSKRDNANDLVRCQAIICCFLEKCSSQPQMH